MNNKHASNPMKQKILSILRGEQYAGSGRGWDALEVWADATDFYHSLDNAIERADFERVVVEFLYSDSKALRGFALDACHTLQIRAAIPWLLTQLHEAPDASNIAFICLILAKMRVPEAAGFFEAKGYALHLFRVDFYRSIPLIQRLIERTCVGGYDKRKAKKIPRPPLYELEEIFFELYERFGSKGIFLLLEELEISDVDQRNFVLDAVREVSMKTVSRAVIARSKQGEPATDDEIQEMKTESLKLVEEVRQWIQARASM